MHITKILQILETEHLQNSLCIECKTYLEIVIVNDVVRRQDLRSLTGLM